MRQRSEMQVPFDFAQGRLSTSPCDSGQIGLNFFELPIEAAIGTIA
jgi:hypothetical protein